MAVSLAHISIISTIQRFRNIPILPLNTETTLSIPISSSAKRNSVKRGKLTDKNTVGIFIQKQIHSIHRRYIVYQYSDGIRKILILPRNTETPLSEAALNKVLL